MYNFTFFGSDEFSIIVLEELMLKGFVPSLCITQPDRPQGRKLVLTPTPLKEFCLQNSIPVQTPDKLTVDFFEQIGSFDFFVIASYGKIISQKIIDIPTHGCFNVHPSLLPAYRGASPIETAILNDTLQTGVTIMLMDALMDHGPILNQRMHNFKVWPENKKVIHDTLAHIGGELLAETITPHIEGKITPQTQNHTEATFTKMIKKEDGHVDIKDTDYATYLKYLAFTPWPGLFFFVQKQNGQIRIKIESAHFEPSQGFVIDTVIPEGKNSMSFESFKNGYLS